MKLLLSSFILILSISSFGQEVSELTFECLDDPKSGGRVFQLDTSSYQMKMVLKTYGPCGAGFRVEVSEMPQEDGITNVAFEIFDKKEIYKGGEIKMRMYV